MKIQPIQTAFDGELSELKVVVNSFDIEDKSCMLTWSFFNQEQAEIKSGNYSLTEDEYKNWGTENNYLYLVITDYFNRELSLNIVPLEKIVTKTTEEDGF